MNRKNKRGVTIVEVMVTVTILGIFMILIGYEFDHTVWHLFHTQSNVDTESNARVVMTRVVNGLKAATPNLENWSSGSVILQPGGPGTSPVLRYKRARTGSLADPTNVRLDKKTGAPEPFFDQVQLACATLCSPTTP
ncbi:MAG: type II secretion system GspH family protein, partial [Candidatus Eremiobacteraeota bacterium]|nr:type II secretion system GspH family protein [Candidatus Eremiobacteraeota bacterium]